jgi:hypothetical protein
MYIERDPSSSRNGRHEKRRRGRKKRKMKKRGKMCFTNTLKE